MITRLTVRYLFYRNDLEELKPDPDRLLAAHNNGKIRGVIVTVKNDGSSKDCAGKSYDFMSRYFAPWVGIPEDPVTGDTTNLYYLPIKLSPILLTKSNYYLYYSPTNQLPILLTNQTITYTIYQPNYYLYYLPNKLLPL